MGTDRITLLASIGQVLVRLRDADDDPTSLQEYVARARELLGRAVFTDRGSTLEATVGELLRDRGQTLVSAESCTGGLLGSRLTATPGSSAYYLGGAVWSLCVPAGLGAALVLRSVPRARGAWRLAAPAAVLALLVAGWVYRTAGVAPYADASSDRTGFEYAEQVIGLPPDALVVSHGDGRSFSLWYGAGVLAARPDVVVIYDNLLDWRWYRTQLAVHHPELDLPSPGVDRELRHRFLAEMHVDHRPVFVTAVEPALRGGFTWEPHQALFRVRRAPADGVIAGASSGRTDTPPDPTLRTADETPRSPR